MGLDVTVVTQWLGTCLWCERSQVRPVLAARKISVSEHAFSSVICRDDTRLVHRPFDQDLNWMSPVQGKSLPVQVKEPYGNLDMVTCRPGVYKVHLPIILERGSGSI